MTTTNPTTAVYCAMFRILNEAKKQLETLRDENVNNEEVYKFIDASSKTLNDKVIYDTLLKIEESSKKPNFIKHLSEIKDHGQNYCEDVPREFRIEHFEDFKCDELKKDDILVKINTHELGQSVDFYRILKVCKSSLNLEHIGCNGVWKDGSWIEWNHRTHPLRWTFTKSGDGVKRNDNNGGYIGYKVKAETLAKYTFE